MPPPTERHTGIPTGHPNSTVFMSSPIRLRSSLDGKLFSHSPHRLPTGLCPVKDGLDTFTLQVGLGASFGLGLRASVCHKQVYHIRYIESRISGRKPCYRPSHPLLEASFDKKQTLFSNEGRPCPPKIAAPFFVPGPHKIRQGENNNNRRKSEPTSGAAQPSCRPPCKPIRTRPFSS